MASTTQYYLIIKKYEHTKEQHTFYNHTLSSLEYLRMGQGLGARNSDRKERVNETLLGPVGIRCHLRKKKGEEEEGEKLGREIGFRKSG